MSPDQKIRIIRRFLREKTSEPLRIGDADVLRDYNDIGVCLDWIEEHAADIFDITTFEANLEKWNIFLNILGQGVKLEKGSPPALKSAETSLLEGPVAFWRRDLQLSHLPGCDYYHRNTTMVAHADGLNTLITRSKEKMQPIIRSFLPSLDINNHQQVQKEIEKLSAKAGALPEGGVERTTTEQKLAILTDLNKINLLQSIDIPQEGSPALHYCTLAEAAGGVTEKVSLIKRDKVIEQLQKLDAAVMTTPREYADQRDGFKLSTQAILKLPKHSKIEEVQREAMALNLSRILGLTTTQSTMVSYRDKPALFVPFDDICLLKEVSTGKVMQAYLFSTGKYTHYSTLNPVGEGMQPEQFIDDFGGALGLFYLCSDTDAIGGYSQNKALKGNNLFIFDQVLTYKDKLGLDSRLSMQPISFFTRHMRHDQGRNRTLIEDASFDSSYESVMQLKSKQLELSQYCARVVHLHNTRLRELDGLYERTSDRKSRQKFSDEISLVTALRDDAVLLGAKIDERIKKIDGILPGASKGLDPGLSKQALVLELLVNRPRLYTDDGRPYRAPWTTRNTINILRVTPVGGQLDRVKIEFSKAIPPDVLAMIKRQGNMDLQIGPTGKEVLISVQDLQALNEKILFPELQGGIIAEKNYLDPVDIEVIQASYDIGHRGRIINAINDYRVRMGAAVSVDDKLACMQEVEDALKEYIDTAKDKGFGMHMLKKFHFDVQQRLQTMMPSEGRPAQINAAFSAALKLDQISQFNRVVKEAIRQNKVTDPAFLGFLGACVDKVGEARDHFSACALSAELAEQADVTIRELQRPLQQQQLAQLLHADEEERDLLVDVDPVAEFGILQEAERGVLEERMLVVAPLQEDSTDSKDNIPPQIDVTT